MATAFVLTNGELLAKARKDAGMTQNELAGQVGVSEETVSRWERNLSGPSARELKAVEETTGALWLWVQLRRELTLSALDLHERVGINR